MTDTKHTDIKMMLGNKVREARRLMKLSQKALADRVGTKQSNVSRAESKGCDATLAEKLITATGARLKFHHISIVLPDGSQHTSFYG